MKKGQELVNIYCPIVISDAGLFNTYKNLLPENAHCLPGKTGAAWRSPRFPVLPDAFPRVVAAL